MSDEKLMSLDESARRINQAKAENLMSWQRTTLPFVQWGIGLLAIIVFGSIIFAGTVILPNIVKGSDHVQEYADTANSALKGSTSKLEVAKISIMAYQSARQHDRASAAILTRELLRFSGFMIGAALCFIGALFIIGKFADQESSTAILEGQGYHASLASASPGIFALVVGGALVSVGIFAHYKVELKDPFLLGGYDSLDLMTVPVEREALSDENKAAFDMVCKEDPENQIC
ncbi:hypothetical protein [Hyphomonas jannaschiana]|uniref:hypothetical protein n=1 Tax=Hyphomonas jannaschiana TaxID=86 RepID=UPI0035C71809